MLSFLTQLLPHTTKQKQKKKKKKDKQLNKKTWKKGREGKMCPWRCSVIM